MATVLEEILEIYESLDEMRRKECSPDIPLMIQHILISLKMESLSVALTALKLLEMFSTLHAQGFLLSIDDLFTTLLVSLLSLSF